MFRILLLATVVAVTLVHCRPTRMKADDLLDLLDDDVTTTEKPSAETNEDRLLRLKEERER